MSNLFLILSFVLITNEPPSESVTKAELSGVWSPEENQLLLINLYLANNATYIGKVKEDKSKPVNVGKIILHDFVYSTTKKCYIGEMTPPGTSMRLDAELFVISESKIKIVAHKSIFTKTMILNKVA
jgi:hypothetical protein